MAQYTVCALIGTCSPYACPEYEFQVVHMLYAVKTCRVGLKLFMNLNKIGQLTRRIRSGHNPILLCDRLHGNSAHHD